MSKVFKKIQIFLLMVVIIIGAVVSVSCSGKPTGPVEAEIYVEKIDGLSEDFIKGADISSYISQIDSGVVYRDWKGKELDQQGFFKLLKDAGLNYLRIRVWNDPYDAEGRGYGGGNNDVEKAITMGKLATKAGMKVLIDFHYSDFWADPNKQQAPKQWENLTAAEKGDKVAAFTEEALQQMLDAGVDVGMVQVGNETNNGICGETTWNNMAVIYQKGCEAVNKIAAAKHKEILVAVHFTDVHKEEDFVRFAAIMNKYSVDYDVFAASYYSYWHGTLDNLTQVLSDIASTYEKKVMVTETAYTYTWQDGDGHPNSLNKDTAGVTYAYPVSVQGQATALHDVMQAVTDIGEAGIGVFYWEPAWIPVAVYDADQAGSDDVLKNNQRKWEEYGSGWASSFAGDYDPKDAGMWYGGSSWDNQAMFDFNGNPLPSLKVFDYVNYGATAPLKVEQVAEAQCDVNPGERVLMPEKITVLYNNNATEEMAVIWDPEQVAKAEENGKGEYLIDGKVSVGEEEYPAVCKLIISVQNYVKNPGMEESDTSMWVSSDACAGVKNDSGNAKTGDYCLHFYSTTDMAFTVEQTVEGLDAGYYNFSVFLQGGDAGSDPEFKIYAVSGEERKEEMTGVTKWQEWSNPEITGIYVPEDGGSVTIGVSVKAPAKAWGAWDDFCLYKLK